MAKKVLLITSRNIEPGDSTHERIAAMGIEIRYADSLALRSDAALVAALRGVDAVIAAGESYNANVLGQCDRLKIIARTGVGYDKIDVAAARERGIVVTNTPGTNRYSVAEWTIMHILMCAKMGAANFAELGRGGWQPIVGFDLAGLTLGIVGLGTIGKEVAQRMRAFEMRVLAYDQRQDPQFAEAHDISYVPLDELMAASDFITIHCNLDASTKHLISGERIALMKPTAYLVNLARGGIVDEVALVEALAERRIAGAGLDVFEKEPLPLDSPLRRLDNVVMSPHAAGASSDARARSRDVAVDDVLRVLRGERARFQVN